MTSGPLKDWLLVSDPALRWQVERDLLDASPEVWEATRTRIATEGFGARLLALQDADGQWAGGSFFPEDYDFAGAERSEGGQPWTATTWTLNTLREWGLDASALRERAGPPSCLMSTAAGTTTTRLTGRVRWIAASTPGH